MDKIQIIEKIQQITYDSELSLDDYKQIKIRLKIEMELVESEIKLREIIEKNRNREIIDYISNKRG